MKNPSLTFQVGDVVELDVQRLSYPYGHGISRLDGFVVFVVGAAPLEKVKAQVTEIHARHAVAQIVEVIVPSSARRPEPCQYAATCGGCTWQHINEQTQLKEKQHFLLRLIHNLGDQVTETNLSEMISSPQNLRYRNRIQVHVVDGQVGYFARGSNHLVAIEDCLLAEPELTKELQKLRQQTSKSMWPGKRRVELIKYLNGQTDQRATSEDPQMAYFAQVNRFTNELLLDYVTKSTLSLDPTPAEVLDLYAGQGNFGLHLAEKLPSTPITMVELSSLNSQTCQKTIGDRQLNHAQAVQADVLAFLSRLRRISSSSLMILDPPRPGCSPQVIQELIRLAPQTVIYVSCNPSTLERDLVRLLKSSPYKLISLQGFDMFPQTPHMEAVAILTNSALRHHS